MFINKPTNPVLITLNLYASSLAFHQAIGFVYLSEDESTVKFSFLNFWGNRVDKEYPLESVMPFLDAPRPPTDFIYKQIEFYSGERIKLKLYMKLGKITDKEKFLKVFGPLE